MSESKSRRDEKSTKHIPLWNRPRLLALPLTLVIVSWLAAPLAAENPSNSPASVAPQNVEPTNVPPTSVVPAEVDGLGGPEQWTSRQGLNSTLQVMLLLTVVSVAPAVLLMTTSFVRIVVVLGLLRQALGTQQLPPNQVLTAIALFMTVLIMTPVWHDVYEDSVKPYTAGQISLEEAWDAGVAPVRRFMAHQISRTGNDDDVLLFLRYVPGQVDPATGELPQYDYLADGDGKRIVPLQALLPAFMLSELKTAFLIGFQIYLPFLIIDVVVASVTISMGMLMLPPVLISLPLKLLLFVLVDGWHLVVGMLLESFQLMT